MIRLAAGAALLLLAIGLCGLIARNAVSRPTRWRPATQLEPLDPSALAEDFRSAVVAEVVFGAAEASGVKVVTRWVTQLERGAPFGYWYLELTSEFGRVVTRCPNHEVLDHVVLVELRQIAARREAAALARHRGGVA
jgi:hypothetical protein